MAAYVEETMMTMVDPKNNKNKFYWVALDSSGNVHSRWGRVGETGRTNPVEYGGKYTYDRIVSKKMSKGYKPAPVVGSTAGTKNDNLREASKRVLVGDSTDARLARLVDRIVAVNAHDIAVATGGKLKVVDGQITTPLGLLHKSAIVEARGVLSSLEAAQGDDRLDLLQRYMGLVPQNVGRSRSWVDTFLTSAEDFTKQRTLLDQLSDSLDFAKKQSDNATDETEDYSDLFRYRVEPVDDKATIARIEKMYRGSANSMHGHRVNGAKIKAVYALTDTKAEAVFDANAEEMGNVQTMWHGSRAFNVLSILSKGLLLPRSLSTARVAGAMFGHGLYFSNQSTKSANYSAGGVWSSGRDNNWYMFVADVVMGNEFRPDKYKGYPNYDSVLRGDLKDSKGRRWNSINVRPGSGGVMNHEAIVPGPEQVALRYLVEFES